MVEKTKRRILVTGSTGMLGSAVLRELSSGYEVLGTSQNDLDITDGLKVGQFIAEARPWLIIHAAALTDVDGCEVTPGLAYDINALGTKNIAQAAKLVGAILIYLSTDYIFDGASKNPYTEGALPNPLSVYGKTKLAGEGFIAEELESFVIVRSSWLFGKGKIGFVEKIIEQAKIKKRLRVVGDKFGTPTYVNDLARAIFEIISLADKGKFIPQREIFHITNSGFCSWLEYAQKIIELSGIEAVTLKPIKQEEFNFKAQRPRFSVLDNSRYIKLIGNPLRRWEDALEEYLKCRNN